MTTVINKWQPMEPGMQIRLRSNPAIVFTIPPRKINIGKMIAQTPDKVTPDNMHQSLKLAGLDCPDTQPSALKPTVDAVSNVLKDNQGKSAAYLIDRVEHDSLYGVRVPRFLSKRSRGLVAASGDTGVSKGQWTPSTTAQGYTAELAVVNAHFDDLLDNYSGFNGTGHKAPQQKKSQDVSNTDAISKLFIDIALTASGEIVNGIDEVTMSSTLSDIIKPALDPTLADYNEGDNRLIYIVFNYDEVTENADGIGFIYIDFRLQIQNYKRKSKDGGDKHTTTVTMNAQSAVYSSIDSLMEHYNWAIHRNAKLSMMVRAIPPRNQFKVFDTLPAANNDTWNAALLLESTGQKLTALVFYGADLTSLGNLDNKASKASSTYSIATTSGFTFTLSEKIGTSTTAEAGVIFAKASVTISFELTFTEQWNSSTTETIQFTVPGNSAAFVYKGYVMTKYLYFDPNTNTYTYGPDGKFYSNYLVTSEKPLNGDPVYQA